jgi:hypothetical protein
MNQIKYITLFLFLIFSQAIYAGGPWTQAQGKAYLKLSEWWTVFDQHYTDTGQMDPNTTTGIFTTALYAEYGITNRFTGQLYFPLLTRNYMNNIISGTSGETLIPGEAINSLGDPDLTLKYGITGPGSNIPVSVSLTLGIPLGEDAGGEQMNLQTGDGEFNQMIQLHAGKSFLLGQNSGFFSGYGGFNNRTQGFSDEIRIGIELGINFLDQKLWLISRLNMVESLKNGETANNITSTSIFANNTEYTSFGIELDYYLTKSLGISASFEGAFRGEIIAAAPSYSVGVFLDLSK